MAQTIGNFKSGFNGGTRANRFIINVMFPSAIAQVPSSETSLKPSTLSYHAIAAKLPSSELGLIQVPYRGRIAYYAGDRDYKPWSVTILDDTGINASWKAFQKWSELLSSHTSNTSTDASFSASSASKLLSEVTITQLHTPSSSGNDDIGLTNLRKITLKHAWPLSIKGIRFDMANGGELVRYDVEFSYDYYSIDTGL